VPIIILSIISTLCLSNNDNTNLIAFNKFLGKEKAEVLDELVASYDEFIENNFPLNGTEGFLIDLKKDFTPNPNWKLNTAKNIKLVDKYEKSRLRKAIYFHYHERDQIKKYDVISLIDTANKKDKKIEYGDLNIPKISYENITNTDSKEIKEEEINFEDFSFYNYNSQFEYGLAKYGQYNLLIKEYLEARVNSGSVSPALCIPPTDDESNVDFEDPFTKIFIVIKFFMGVIASDIERNK